ncbi:MAG: hypothetical protein KGZ39_04765 [Simkania sp.]|nr:hypothetical protein [Simkania sp.]
MALKDTATNLMKLLETCMRDLHKASGGNKAAAQRVRTGTIRLEKTAKVYRKESIAAEKKGGSKKSSKAKAAPKKTVKAKAKKGKKR